MRRLIAYTDGGCRGNPGGVGAWAFLLIDPDTTKALERAGGEPVTTNNRMELLAAIEALKALKGERRAVKIHSDGSYLVKCATEWMPGWKRKGWSRGKEPLKNLDLLKELDALIGKHDVEWQWVPAHAGVPGNERADELANFVMDLIESGKEPHFERRTEWKHPLP